MQINGVQEQHGTALLLAAAPAGKGRLIEASSVVPVLAAVPPAALVGTAAATLIELADPIDPQAVLTRVRGAAATEGPLTVVLVGQLQLDRRQGSVHLALARTTPQTMRYTALPWSWLVVELQQRRPDTTTLYVDLVADPEVWQQLDEQSLPLPGGARAYGVIAPPPGRRRIAHPTYVQGLAQMLRTGRRATADQLHREVLHRAITAEGALILGDAQPSAAVNAQLPPARTAAAIPAPVPTPAPAPVPAPAWAPSPAPVQLPPPVLPSPAAPVSTTTAPSTQARVSPVYVPTNEAVAVEDDPHERIAALAQTGRHREAAALAQAAEQRAVQLTGPDTFATVHWVEVRAHLASVAGVPVQSCELWLQAAQTRLDTLHQALDAQDVEAAVDCAHHQWDRIRDAVHARRLGTQLVLMRRRVPGRQPGALSSIQKRLEMWQAV